MVIEKIIFVFTRRSSYSGETFSKLGKLTKEFNFTIFFRQKFLKTTDVCLWQ